MAKVKVVNSGLDPNLNNTNFNNIPSQTIFSFGKFSITSNFDGRKYIDYNNTLSSFVRPVTLETMGVTETQSQIINTKSTNLILNYDKSDLNTFIRFGSAYEFLRVCIENIILSYPGSLFMNSKISNVGNLTYFDYYFDAITGIASFSVPMNCIVNTFGLSYGFGNVSKPNDMEIRNLNLSYDKYVVWCPSNPEGNSFTVLEYTGNSSGRNYIMLKVKGNPFYFLSGASSSNLDFHVKPNNYIFEEFRVLLNDYEKYIISSRKDNTGFEFNLKDPILLDDGSISYKDTVLLWNTSDGYNIDINASTYNVFLESLLTIGAKYDKIKTDLIARFLTPASLKQYDLTDEGKVTKLLRLYGREFDQLREFIDSLAYINHVTYDKLNNIPDQLVKNLSKTFGWNYFSLVNESELVESFLTIDEQERDLNNDLLPPEIDIELWRRILINTNYFLKAKGTREAIKSIFLLIGIPEPFINITEYVYTVEGKINPNTVQFKLEDFPTNSLPYDTDGYPKAPIETADFYFQISGNTDGGQRYLDVFRKAGFNLIQTPDNKKSWSQSGATYRAHYSTPQYYQKDSKLVLNTKEVDVALDTTRGVEYDVYQYIMKDYAINSSGYTLPYSYVNISLGFTGEQNTFALPSNYLVDRTLGNLEVRFNGILLNSSSVNDSYDTTVNTDYVVDYENNTFTLLNNMYANNNSRNRDVIQATFIYSGGTHSLSGVTVRYVLTRVTAEEGGAIILLPSTPSGDVQVTIDGIALTKGTPQFTADYIVDSENKMLVVQNPILISYLISQKEVQVAYVEVIGTNDIYARSEILRIDSFNSSKIYFNQSANKYVYRLNYKSNNTSDIKILVDGIALEPNKDYSINPQNLYEVFLPRGLKYGTVISVYYLVGNNALFNPIVHNIFGVGDISNLSFLEFIEMVRRKMINARNRKTISDFKGGWYPTLLRIYSEYLKRSKLPSDNPLKSNGYTFANLYPFLNKYNAFFERFVNELLSATIILKGSGLLIRNSIFSMQKFMYRRGVNLLSERYYEYYHDCRGNYMYWYLGDDSSVFKIAQSPSKQPPPTLYVDTKQATASSMQICTGGHNIIGYNGLTSYGILHRRYISNCCGECCNTQDMPMSATLDDWTSWSTISASGSLPSDNYSMNINNTFSNTRYQYKAFIKSGIYGYTGNTLEIITPSYLQEPSVQTKVGISNISSIDGTGGYNIICSQDIDYYGMQYRCMGNIQNADICIHPATINYPSGACTKNISISGDSWNSYCVVKDPSLSWIVTAPPVVLSPTGTTTTVYVRDNAGSERSGIISYIPLAGTVKYVSINQASGIAIHNPVFMTCRSGGSAEPLFELACAGIDTTTCMSSGECYALTLGWYTINPKASSDLTHYISVECNGNELFRRDFSICSAKNCNGIMPSFIVRYNDDIGITVSANAQTSDDISSISSVYIAKIAKGIGNFEIANSSIYMTGIKAETTSIYNDNV